MTIQPIETSYGGYRFRSRLEARWAVFFDHAGIEYRYEPEGFVLPWILSPEWGDRRRIRYLPDFELPGFRLLGEVKASWSARERVRTLNALAALCASGWGALILGDHFRQPRGGSRRPWCLSWSDGGLWATPWPAVDTHEARELIASEGDPQALHDSIDVLRGYVCDEPAPDWYVAAARAAQRARFEFGESP